MIYVKDWHTESLSTIC